MGGSSGVTANALLATNRKCATIRPLSHSKGADWLRGPSRLTKKPPAILADSSRSRNHCGGGRRVSWQVTNPQVITDE
jgi:hypothetical protein